jgi:hypothetical protein
MTQIFCCLSFIVIQIHLPIVELNCRPGQYLLIGSIKIFYCLEYPLIALPFLFGWYYVSLLF